MKETLLSYEAMMPEVLKVSRSIVLFDRSHTHMEFCSSLY